ncbi:AAA family ATPase [Maribacter halichondriae]|uniref:AAA family ATPase n=1 Tax=Maribacter halichondriae TaxID=2980554 RepID=UPI002359C41E|nr:AAA family ATPase [Maribacter sp. Hal144]
MMSNQLTLKSLKIYANNGKVAYYENFHSGVNIIRGDNSSGKSTISHFIFYVLGGSFTSWVDEALECHMVYGEVSLSGVVATLRREISESPSQPMYIYWGGMDDAAKTTEPGQWTKYPYSASANKKSFSNVLFENLNIPIVYGEANITMHQILRLLYVDQDSPTNSLFLYEQFDSALTRNTIAELLLGIYSEDLYSNRLDKKIKSRSWKN